MACSQNEESFWGYERIVKSSHQAKQVLPPILFCHEGKFRCTPLLEWLFSKYHLTIQKSHSTPQMLLFLTVDWFWLNILQEYPWLIDSSRICLPNSFLWLKRTIFISPRGLTYLQFYDKDGFIYKNTLWNYGICHMVGVKCKNSNNKNFKKNKIIFNLF